MINFWNNSLELLSPQDLNNLLSGFPALSSLNLAGNELSLMGSEKLTIIAKHLRDLKDIVLGNTHLEELSIEDLELLFSNMPQCVHLNLLQNYANTMGDAKLHAIFSHLKYVKTILFYEGEHIINPLIERYPYLAKNLRVR